MTMAKRDTTTIEKYQCPTMEVYHQWGLYKEYVALLAIGRVVGRNRVGAFPAASLGCHMVEEVVPARHCKWVDCKLVD